MTTTTPNVDPAEIAKFDHYAARWWDENGEFKLLHQLNPLRLQFIAERCFLYERPVLDVGCGGGILAEGLAGKGAQVCAIDMAEASLTVARLHLMESGLKVDYRLTTVEQLAAQAPESFDVITCMEMLEHVPNPVSVLHACAHLLKPGGHMFLSTINRHPKAYILAILGAEYVMKMLPKGTHDYSKFIQPAELDSWLRHAGMRLQELKGIFYNPISRNFSLSPDISVNYLAHAIKD